MDNGITVIHDNNLRKQKGLNITICMCFGHTEICTDFSSPIYHFVGQNIATRTDGEDQEIVNTHTRPESSSHATNGGVIASNKRYSVKFEV